MAKSISQFEFCADSVVGGANAAIGAALHTDEPGLPEDAGGKVQNLLEEGQTADL